MCNLNRMDLDFSCHNYQDIEQSINSFSLRSVCELRVKLRPIKGISVNGCQQKNYHLYYSILPPHLEAYTAGIRTMFPLFL